MYSLFLEIATPVCALVRNDNSRNDIVSLLGGKWEIPAYAVFINDKKQSQIRIQEDEK